MPRDESGAGEIVLRHRFVRPGGDVERARAKQDAHGANAVKMNEIASTRLRPRNPQPYPTPVRGNDLPGRSGRAKYNFTASSVQINPSKTKQKSLDFLGFRSPNRDFSMGYGESK
jgi:hypothetical protein